MNTHGVGLILAFSASMAICAGCCCWCCRFAWEENRHQEGLTGFMKDASKIIDVNIENALGDGTIRLLSCAWLLSHPMKLICRLQDLPEEALLSTADAVAAFKKGKV